MRAVKASGAPVQFEIVDNMKEKVTPEVLASIRKNGVALKGEFITGVGKGTPVSVNIELRKALGLYANVVHSFNMPGVASRHENVDVVIIRENTEGEYSGMEHEVYPGVTESLKVMTRDGTRRIAQYAFEYALLNNRNKVTAVHKANIMKKADGIFLESCQEVAKVRADERGERRGGERGGEGRCPRRRVPLPRVVVVRSPHGPIQLFPLYFPLYFSCTLPSSTRR
jgi:isocitrate dehydrogenase (NAD+)